MSQTIASPSPIAAVRRTFAGWWRDPDSRSVLVGLGGMVLVHLLLLLFAPHALRLEHAPSVLRPHSSAREFSIQIAPDTFTKMQQQPQVQPPPMKFVETNPNAPENIPDKTNNFGAQNQQAAQEKPQTENLADRPAIEGQKEIHSSQIVSGQLTKTVELPPAPAAPETPPSPNTTDAARQEQNPLPGFEKTEGDNQNAYGTNKAKAADGAKPIPEKIDGAKDVPLVQGATGVQPMIDPRRPRPRPQIVKTQQVRPAIFEENKFGSRNIGPAAYDARWSNYGAYLQKLIETVQIQWERILIESRVYPVGGTHVSVRFRIDKEGKIPEIINVDGTAGEQAKQACISAITSRAPYGEWTDDMVALLGEQQEMTFTFYYQ